jgi:hypothetical protein
MIAVHPYNIEDIDWAWKTLLEAINPLSDGTTVPVFVEAQFPERIQESIPALSVTIVSMVPDLDRAEGWCSMIGGYEYDQNGMPTNEISIYQPEHYMLQYRIGAISDNPLHDRELMLKVGAFLTPRPQLFLTTAHKGLFLEAEQVYVPAINTRTIFEDASRINNDQRLYERVWLYVVHASIPHPAVGRDKVARSIEWQTPGDRTNDMNRVSLKIERGPADDNVANEYNLVDNSGETGNIHVKVDDLE